MKINFISKYQIEGVENYATIEDCVRYLLPLDVIGIDIETSKKLEVIGTYNESIYKGGLDPYLSNVIMLQIGDLKESFVIDMRDFSKEELSPLIKLINWNKEKTFVGHNLKFEQLHLKHNYDIEFYKIHDTMICEICLTNGLQKRYDLAELARRYLGVAKVQQNDLFNSNIQQVTIDEDTLVYDENAITPYEIEDNELIDKSIRLGFLYIRDRKFTKEQILYGSNDIKYPLLIRERQLKGRLLENGTIYRPTKLFNLENNFVPVTAEMEYNGLPLNIEKWMELAKKAEEEMKFRANELNQYVIQHYDKFKEEPNLFNSERLCTVEWSSPSQVVDFFKYLKICPKVYNKLKGYVEWTVGAKELQKTLSLEDKEDYLFNVWKGFEKDENGIYKIDNNRLILNYILYKKSEQLATTFGYDWIKYVHPITKRVHTKFRQILSTGRLASTNPNVQNIPNGKEYRACFDVMHQDYFNDLTMEKELCFTDYSAQEIRTCASVSKCKAMLEFYKNGDAIYGSDFHMFTCNKMHKVNFPDADDLPANGSENFTSEHKKMRNRTKIVEFRLIYGGSSTSLANEFNISQEEGDELYNGFFGAYPEILKLKATNFKRNLRNNYILMDKVIDRRYFNEDFNIAKEVEKEVKKFYPEDYFTNKMSREEKNKIKDDLEKNQPEVKKLWKKYFGILGSIERKSINYAVQSPSAGQMKSALINIRRTKIERNYSDLLIITTVHDEAGIEYNKENSHIYEKLIKESMINMGNLFVENITMDASPASGSYWIH